MAATDVITDTSQEGSSNTYTIRPNFQHKFRPAAVKECIHQILTDFFVGKSYSGDECTTWCKNISHEIKDRLKEMGYDRYKFIVQVVIGEQRGEGVKMACRCFWDSDTDNCAQDIFMNDSLFCVAVCFGVFYY